MQQDRDARLRVLLAGSMLIHYRGTEARIKIVSVYSP